MANTIKIKRSSVSGKVPTTSQLELGELAVNTHDGKLYTKKDDGTAAVVQIGDAASTADALSTARSIALSGDVSGSTSFDGSANVTITATVADDSHNHVISNVDGLQTALDAKAALASPALTGTPTAPTAAAGTNTTQVATTAFVSTAVANVVDSAPGALDTLNELAAALGDDANFSTTVTNSIATKLPLAGGQMTGNITFSSTQTVDGRDLSVDGAKLDGIEAGATADQTASEILTAIKTVDGSGSGLDADTVDGLNSSSFLRSDANDTATGIITFQNGNDYQIALNGAGTTWAGISFTDTNGSDYMWFNGSNGTFAIGGGGSNVAGKKLHVDGGLSVGSTADSTSTPSNGIYSQGDISVGGNTVLNAGNYTSYAPSLTGSGASGSWGISVTGSSASCTGNAATATQATSVTASADNTANVTRYVGFVSGQTGARGILTDTGLTYNPSSNTLTASTFSGALSGNASTASTLQTARTINGTSFNGSANITITANTSNTLSRGSYLTGSNFNGSAATTWAVDATSSNTANKVVARDGNGDFSGRYITGTYLFSSYLNMSHSQTTRSSDTIFYSSTDNYLRKNNASGMRSSLSVPHLAGNNTFTLAQRGQVDALSSASTITPNFNNSNNFSISLSTNTTIANPSNLVAGQSGAIAITYNGAYTVAFGSYWKFPGGTAPTATSTSGKTDVLVYYVESSTRISAQLLLNMGG